jgi:hypothetical protein
MLIKAKDLKGYKLHSLDGEIGKVEEFYFDDHHWTIRYLVAETGNWLADRQVLISPHALGVINKQEEYITIELTKKQIEDSPSLGKDKPVSMQFEESYYGYYGYPMYWGGSYMWGASPYIMRGQVFASKPAHGKRAWNSNLSSTHAVNGYAIQAEDGGIGHVDDFIIDDETWAIRYLVIDTRNWLPGKKVLISPKWISNISWSQSTVFVNLLRDAIRLSPEYTEKSLLNRDYETGLHQHYNRQGYWVDEQPAKKHAS